MTLIKTNYLQGQTPFRLLLGLIKYLNLYVYCVHIIPGIDLKYRCGYVIPNLQFFSCAKLQIPDTGNEGVALIII